MQMVAQNKIGLLILTDFIIPIKNLGILINQQK